MRRLEVRLGRGILNLDRRSCGERTIKIGVNVLETMKIKTAKNSRFAHLSSVRDSSMLMCHECPSKIAAAIETIARTVPETNLIVFNKICVRVNNRVFRGSSVFPPETALIRRPKYTANTKPAPHSLALLQKLLVANVEPAMSVAS